MQYTNKIFLKRTLLVGVVLILFPLFGLAALPQSDSQVEILSPEPNSQVMQDEVSIVISFIKLKERVSLEKSRLVIDGTNVTDHVEFYDDFLVLTPPKIRTGLHKVELVLVGDNGETVHMESFQFTVVGQDKSGLLLSRRTPKPVSGRAFINFRNQSLQDNEYQYSYFYSGIRLNGKADRLKWTANVLYSNQDKSDRQPVNQFGAGFVYTPMNNVFLALNAGDMFPVYDDLFFFGIRNRGVELKARAKFFEFAYLKGNISRAIDEKRDSLFIVRPGVYKRQVTGLMPTIHITNHSQTRFYYLHYKDDKGSIDADSNPEENTLFGVSQAINAFQNRFLLNLQFAGALYNRNITSGNTPFDSLKEKLDLSNDDKKYYDLIKKFITVNQNWIADLPWALKLNASYSHPINYFSIHYKNIKDGFVSFGNPFLLTDISGLSVMDRVQIIKGKTYLTVNYEKFSAQNSDENKEPLDIQRVGFAINYFPGPKYPSFSLGFTNHSRVNNQETDSIYYGEDNSINQLYVNSNYKLITGAVHHDLNVNFSNYIKTDKLNSNGDNASQTISASIKSTFNNKSWSRVFFTLNNSDIAKGDSLLESTFKNTSFGFQLGYKLANLFRDDFLSAHIDYYYSKRDYQALLSDTKQLIARNSFSAQLNYNMKQNGRLYVMYQFAKYGKDVNYGDKYVVAGYEVRF